eukprot:535596-Pleurochrysis_carterae.AAC.3
MTDLPLRSSFHQPGGSIKILMSEAVLYLHFCMHMGAELDENVNVVKHLAMISQAFPVPSRLGLGCDQVATQTSLTAK